MQTVTYSHQYLQQRDAKHDSLCNSRQITPHNSIQADVWTLKRWIQVEPTGEFQKLIVAGWSLANERRYLYN